MWVLFSSHRPFPPWMQFKSLLDHWITKLYTIFLIFCTFTLVIRGFLLYLLTLHTDYMMRDLKYCLKEKRRYTNIIRMLRFSWLRSLRLFVDDNNLVDYWEILWEISALIQYVCICYSVTFLPQLSKSEEASGWSWLISSEAPIISH